MAFADGRLVPADEATVPLLDAGLIRGDGCFEVARVRNGRPSFLDDHLERFARSAAALGLPLDGVADAFAALAVGFDGCVRVLITRGPPPRVFGVQEAVRVYPAALRLRSVSAPWLAAMGSTTLAGAKTLSYGPNMAARRAAQAEGADDALLVNREGVVLEGPTAAFLWVENAELMGPPLDLGILDSVSRKAIARLMPIRLCTANIERVQRADEALMTSTTLDVKPVAALDGREWSPTPGPVTARLMDEFDALVSRESSP